MRRIMLWIVSTVAAVVLLFSYRTSTSGPQTPSAAAGGAQPPGVVAEATPAPSPSASGTSTPASGTHTPAKTTRTPAKTPPTPARSVSVNGTVAQTRWGPVQVQVHLTGTKITDVVALVYPSGNGHDQEINAYALPQLRQQALTAQSARIDGVSGATVTSDGYRDSLQAALAAAHFPG